MSDETRLLAEVSRVADNLENINNTLEELRVEFKKKRYDDVLATAAAMDSNELARYAR